MMALVMGVSAASFAAEPTYDCDLLVVGGSESGVAAAVQAARLGVRRIVLVNDCNWLGGQFTAEGLCAVDEWTKYRDGRVHFPRSGLFLEIMQKIEADMQRKYGNPRPGNCFCAWTTCEPRDTELLFRELVEPYLKSHGGPLEILENLEPVRVVVEENRVAAVEFEENSGGDRPLTPTSSPSRGEGNKPKTLPLRITLRPRLTIDASDWGDVVRLSGAKYYCGPDLKERFNEPSAPTSYDQVGRNEINPITYNLVLRESAVPTIIPEPKHYDERRYYAATIATRDDFKRLGWPKEAMKPFAPAWRDTALPNGPYTDGPTVYHHRRLVDRRHFGLAPGTETVLVNWPLQDYPTDRFPQNVVDALEQAEPGASQKNLAEMTPALRRIVFADAKLHSLGLLHHLQTTAAERDLAAAGGKPIVTFRDLKLTDEFGTPDGLPLKPYVREGLRTQCLYMLREQDVRDTDGVQCWAKTMAPDGVFGFQFNIDFHPTRRIFLKDDPRKTWTLVHTKFRNWSTDTDRSMLPLRCLVPREIDGLLVAGKNLGVSSIVQSALRLHGHGMLAGQAAGTAAYVSLDENAAPRDLVLTMERVRRVQRWLLEPRDLVTGTKPPGVLIWPYHDLSPADSDFAELNLFAVRSLYTADDQSPEFGRALKPTAADVKQLLEKCRASIRDRFADDSQHRDEAIRRLEEHIGKFEAAWNKPDAPISRVLLAKLVDGMFHPDDAPQEFLQPGKDSDGDGIPDLDDPLPQDRDNDNVPDMLEAPEKPASERPQ